MQSHKILSIVIPTYNMEELLPRCLDSLTADSSILDALEILVINDGSKDRSLSIMQDYQNRFPNTVKAVDKPNGNYGSCINRGLAEATAKYIKILDSDDWFNMDNLVSLINKLAHEDVDMVLTDYNYVIPDSNQFLQKFSLKENVLYDNTIFSTELLNRIDMHGVTYRTEILKKSNYVQTEGISYTDQEWIFYPIINVESVIYYPLNIYQYMLGRDGQTMDPVVLKKKIGDNHLIVNKMIDWFRNINWSKEKSVYKHYIDNRLLGMIKVIYKTYLLEDDMKDLKLLKELDTYIKGQIPDLYSKMNEMKIHNKFLPVKFINHWHQTGKKPSKVILSANRVLKNIQNKISQ